MWQNLLWVARNRKPCAAHRSSSWLQLRHTEYFPCLYRHTEHFPCVYTLRSSPAEFGLPCCIHSRFKLAHLFSPSSRLLPPLLCSLADWGSVTSALSVFITTLSFPEIVQLELPGVCLAIALQRSRVLTVPFPNHWEVRSLTVRVP